MNTFNSPKKILILSGLKIFPNQSGGHLRSGSVAKSLARMGHEVCIYSIAGRKSDYGNSNDILYQAIEENLVEEVNLSLSIGLIQALARRLGLPRIWQFLLLRFGFIPSSLRNRLSWADVIICDLPYTPPIPGIWSKKIWLLLSHNLEHRLLAQGSRIEKWTAPWMERIEMLAPLRYDGILACAKEDGDYFKKLSSRPESVRLVANGIDPDLYRKSDVEGLGLRHSYSLTEEDWLIVFSGSRFGPNLEALAKLEAFSEREADYLAKKRIKFLVLGSIVSAPRIKGAMIYTGPVKETYPYFAAADAALNPVEIGSGSNVKIFEYLAAQLPVLSTAFGVRGTMLVKDRDYIEFKAVDLKAALDRLLNESSKTEWKAHANRVWARVQDSCDMTAILKREWKSLPLEKIPPPPAISQVSVISGTHIH